MIIGPRINWILIRSAEAISPEAAQAVPQGSDDIRKLRHPGIPAAPRKEFDGNKLDATTCAQGTDDPFGLNERAVRNELALKQFTPPELDTAGVLSLHTEQQPRQ